MEPEHEPARDATAVVEKPIAVDMAIFEIGKALGHALTLSHSLLLLAADPREEGQLAALIAALKAASGYLGVTIWDEESD
jgi:hypothetical protein